MELESLTAANPDNELAFGMLAAVWIELKRPETAMRYFKRVLEINPQNALARFQLGLVLLDTDQPEAALAILKEGQYGASECLIDYHRGIALLALEQRLEALERFQRARTRMPVDHPLYPQLLSHLIRLSPS